MDRRAFLKAAAAFPAIVPASVLGRQAPGGQVAIGAIGTGRISRVHDLPGVWKRGDARVVAVCDLDSKRLEDARQLVNGHYAATTMDEEHSGPLEIWGTAEFPKSGLWDVHGPFRTEAVYASGVRMIVSGDFPNGIRFEGSEGWIFVSRGNEAVTASDPQSALKDAQALASSNPAIITSVIGPNDVHLEESADHHGNWLDAVRSRRQPIAPFDVAHRSCSACLLHHIAMKAGRRLRWDPAAERFVGDDAANAMLSRPQRAPYTLA